VAAFELQGPSGYLQTIGLDLQRHCLASGLFLRPLGSVVYLMPPLCISAAELERSYELLAQGLAAL
jgi:adenosylmethionine-8-amino-7-oxononanoate aminotransferase